MHLNAEINDLIVSLFNYYTPFNCTFITCQTEVSLYTDFNLGRYKRRP